MIGKAKLSKAQLEKLNNGESVKSNGVTVLPPCDEFGHDFSYVRANKDGDNVLISRRCSRCDKREKFECEFTELFRRIVEVQD